MELTSGNCDRVAATNYLLGDLAAAVLFLGLGVIGMHGETPFAPCRRQRGQGHGDVSSRDLGVHLDLRHAGQVVADLFHQLHSKFLVRHFAAAELELDPDLVPLVEKLFAVPDLGQVIVVVDVYAEFDFLELGSRRPLVLLLLRDVVTEFSEIDDFTDRGVGRGRNLDQIETEALSFAQRVRQLHDAELLAGGPENDPHFAGANPTVYT